MAFFWTGSSILPRLHQPAHEREPEGSRSVSPGASVVADGLGDACDDDDDNDRDCDDLETCLPTEPLDNCA